MGWTSRIVHGVGVLAVVAALAVGEGYRRFTGPGPLAVDTTVVVPKGAGLDAVGRRLEETGVVSSGRLFTLGARLERRRPRAGEYLFPAGISAEAALVMMAEGHTVVHKLTVAEGLTVRHVVSLVLEADYLAGVVTSLPPEGSLLPDTWHLSRDDPRDEVLGRMQKAMHQTLETLWAGRAPNLPLKTPEQALVLASIVERETGLASERPRVAAVFENRLRQGMRLQSDPTVIYGLSQGWGVLDHPLTRDDLARPHPWNTYVVDGLPPTPIANPGRASLEAVLHPAAGDDLYFVADGSGGHVFASTLAAHNANVAKWRRYEASKHNH